MTPNNGILAKDPPRWLCPCAILADSCPSPRPQRLVDTPKQVRARLLAGWRDLYPHKPANPKPWIFRICMSSTAPLGENALGCGSDAS